MDYDEYARRIYDAARLDLARTNIKGFAELELAFERATFISATTLDVDRVSVWVMMRGGTQIRCLHQYERSAARATASSEALDATMLPRYRGALESRRAVVAHDARTDPLTSELRPYFEAHGITSTLDVPIFREGDLFGIVCHEHVGPPRRWTEREEYFAAAVGDIVGMFFESAARMHAEAQLRRAESRLRQAQKVEAVGLFAGGLAHDINNLLAIVSTCGQSLLRAAQKYPELETDARAVVDASTRGGRLVRELSQFGRRRPDDAKPLDLVAAIAQRASLFQLTVGQDVRLELELPAHSVWARVNADDAERVLMNLLSNARDAMPQGGTVTVRVGAEVVEDTADASALPGEYAVIAVTDTGTGISEEVRAKIFDPLFTTKPEGTSTGLGLAVALALVTQAGGAMRVASSPGSGATFQVYLPRVAPT